MAKSKAEYWLTEEGLAKLRHWKRNDLKDEQIFNKMGICSSTFYEWQNKYVEISEALKKGKEDLIADAEEALESRLKPYEYYEEQVETWQTGDNITKTHKKKTKKIILPDTTLIIFTLKSLAGWRDNTEQTDTTANETLREILKGIKENAINEETE